VRLRQTVADATLATGNVRAYVYRYNSGTQVYTPLFTAISGDITPGVTAATYSFDYTTTEDEDMQGEYLYIHYTWQSSSGGSGGKYKTTIAFHVEGTGLADADKPRIEAGTSSIPTLGYPLLFLTVTFFIFALVKKGTLQLERVQT
jgi:hypothetical protein